MSKTKRLLAMTLAVLMMVSLMSVITFAATPVFATSYVDSTGTIKKTALYVAPNLKGKTGDVTAKWDGKNYTFTMGKNAFGDIDSALAAADLNMTGETSQLILGAGDFGALKINMPIEIYGQGWKTNPNVKNASDPTAAWTLNTAWKNNVSVVGHVVIGAGVYDVAKFCGIQISGRIIDFNRAVNSSGTVLTFENVLYSQTSAGMSGADSYKNSSTRSTNTNYAMSFRNYNANNAAVTGKSNKDVLYFTNFRVEDLISTRFIDEQAPPKVIWDGLYFDFAKLGDQGFWFKWMPYFDKCEFTVKNSYFKGVPAKSSTFNWEGYGNGIVGDAAAKIPVGESFPEQYSEFNFVNNVVIDTVDELSETKKRAFTINAHSYSKIDISNNLVINSVPAARTWLSFSYTDSRDYTDIMTIRDNTFIGVTEYNIPFGSEDSKADLTGNFITPVYDPNYKAITDYILPTGKVGYEYCYLNGARTRKTNEVPDFTIAGATVNKADKTITLSASAAAELLTPSVSGLPGYTIYESDATFSNVNYLDRYTPVEACALKNTTNHFLFVALSYDSNTKVPYQMTITKPKTEGVGINALTNLSAGAEVTNNGLAFDVIVERDIDNFSFGVDANADFITITDEEGEEITANEGIYSISDLVLGEPVELKAVVTKGSLKDTYYINVKRDLSNKAAISSIGSNLAVNGTTYTATLSEMSKEFTFDIAVSEGATVAAWKGTTVFTEKNGKITLSGLKSGTNTFTLGVTAENGRDYTLYTLVIENPKSTEAELFGIADAEEIDGDYYVSIVEDVFTIVPEISEGATFKVYSDEACTNEVSHIVSVDTSKELYIVVIAEDGVTKSEPSYLYIERSTSVEGPVGDFAVEGGVADDDIYNWIYVNLAKDTKTTTLKINTTGTYKLYADTLFTVPATTTVTLDSGITCVYAHVTYTDGSEDVYTIFINSPRSIVAYKDSASIPSWAQKYINALNESGIGILKGDDKGNFNAKNNMTRYEIAAVAVRLLGFDATQFASVKLEYTDKIAAWAEKYVKAVTALGIMGGSKDAKGTLVFNGQGATTRAQFAKIIVEVVFLTLGVDVSVDDFYALDKAGIDAAYNEFKFADESKVQNWAKTYTKVAVFLGLLNGKVDGGKNILDPNSNINRAEISAVCARFLGLAE